MKLRFEPERTFRPAARLLTAPLSPFRRAATRHAHPRGIVLS